MGRVVKRLADENPSLLNEWDYDKNKEIADPTVIAAYSTIKVWWICSKCGHKWMSDVKHRHQGCGCPDCARLARARSSSKKSKVSSTYNLSVLNKKLSSEWDDDKNDLRAKDVTPGTHKKVWWRCNVCNNSWEASIASRVNGSGCPYCSGRKIVTGKNDLFTLHPELEIEWNYSRNQGIDPMLCASNTHKKVWWKCRVCGNEWLSAISDRSRGNGCPSCSFSNRTSEQEQILYYYLHCVFPDAINSYRPKWIGGSSEIDIYIPSIRVGVEYDGSRWHKELDRDLRKDCLVSEHGITLFRVREVGCPLLESSSICINVNPSDYNKGYMTEIVQKLIKMIIDKFKISVSFPNIDIDRDRTAIFASYEGNKRNHSLKVISPEIANDWNYEKNNGLLPENIANQSNKKVWWLCQKCGFEWEATANNRIKRGCPACSNKIVWIGHNDIISSYPEMAKLWNYKKNIGLSPENFTAGAEAMVWWQCAKCGYEWEAMIYHMKRAFDHNVNGVLCPACVGKAIWKGHNDLQSLRPDLAEEWNYARNNGICPDEITVGSSKNIWWKCKNCGYEWHTSPYNRIRNGSNCPLCAKKQVAMKNGKPVRCIETGVIYVSAVEAGKAIGRSASAITGCLKRPSHASGGFHWEYYNNTDEAK